MVVQGSAKPLSEVYSHAKTYLQTIDQPGDTLVDRFQLEAVRVTPRDLSTLHSAQVHASQDYLRFQESQ